jgi:hypothetical protein
VTAYVTHNIYLTKSHDRPTIVGSHLPTRANFRYMTFAWYITNSLSRRKSTADVGSMVCVG